MQIKKIEIEGLHKSINTIVTIDNDLAILVGINGSGKTSLLTLTTMLVKLDLKGIASYEFNKVLITGQSKKIGSIQIQALRQLNDLTIEVTFERRSDISSSFKFDLSSIDYIEYINNDLARRLAIARDILKSLAPITLVKLDRSIFINDRDDDISFDNPGSETSESQKNSENPIIHVEKTIREKYAKYKQTLIKLQENLNNKLILQLFQSTDVFALNTPAEDIISESDAILGEKQINDLERLVAKSSFYPKSTAARNEIAVYFHFSRLLTEEANKEVKTISSNNDIWRNRFLFVARQRFEKLKTIAKELKQFDQEAVSAKKEVSNYIDQVNKFMRDSNKQIAFSEEHNDLKFSFLTENDDRKFSLHHLSSGERQIVMILAYLAFSATEESIFILDEPELSLHIKWQAEILPALMKLKPKKCQLIVATHSPDVIGEFRSNVSLLSSSHFINT